MRTLSSFLYLFFCGGIVRGYEGTATFDSILVAHASPSFCPPKTGFNSYEVDANYIACCNQWYGGQTLTTGLGPGSKPVYGCCRSGYTCTAPVSLMKDWEIDSSGDLQTKDLPNPPTPAPGQVPPSAPVTASPSRSTGTISQPGATPITTSAGVVIYVSSNNQNNNNNQNTNTVSTGGGGTDLSAGAIAGITLVCTIVMAVAAVLGLRWKKNRKKGKEVEYMPRTQEAQPSTAQVPTSPGWQQPQSELYGQRPYY